MAVQAIALCFQIYIAVLLRGNVGDVGMVIAFMRQIKRDVVDHQKNTIMAGAMQIYWLYSFYLIAKRWEIDTCHDLLGGFADQLAAPNIRAVLLLLEKQDLDSNKASTAVHQLETSQANPSIDLDYKIVDKRLREYFVQNTQQPAESLGLSFEKIQDIERNQQEIASIIKSLRNTCLPSRH